MKRSLLLGLLSTLGCSNDGDSRLHDKAADATVAQAVYLTSSSATVVKRTRQNQLNPFPAAVTVDSDSHTI